MDLQQKVSQLNCVNRNVCLLFWATHNFLHWSLAFVCQKLEFAHFSLHVPKLVDCWIVMAPVHSKIYHDDGDKERPSEKRPPLMECAMNKIAQGAAVFKEECVEAMAEGKDAKLPKNLDDIVVNVESDDDGREKSINCDKVLQPIPKGQIVMDEEVRTCSHAIEKAVCPKCNAKRNRHVCVF